jgi:GT2 family glycosyltransferase
MSARLGVQLVTYHNGFEQLLRTLRGVEATIAKARAGQLVGDVTVRMGDCAERQWYSADELAQFAAAVPSAAFSYRFFDANLGSGGGSNKLAEGVDEDLLWVLNPDTYPAPSCLTELITALEHDDVGVAEGRQIPLEHPKAYDPVTGDTSWGSGCCLLFERAAFDQVGGFDPHYFPMYCDDVDVSWRMQLAGRRVVHAPRAAVFHDKRFDDGGGVEASEFAQYSSALARLFLAHRYGRVDLADELLSWIDRAGPGATDAQRRAAAEFRERQARGDVPPPLPGAEHVAQFVHGEYAVHRWTYGAPSGGGPLERVTAEDRLNERLRQENLLLRWRNDVMTEYADLHAPRMHATAQESAGARAATGDVPVIVISRDRLDCLRQLVEWLERTPGIGPIHIVDNASSWPPLLDYLAQSPHTVHRLEVNLGHHAPWVIGLVAAVSDAPFVVTDPDVLPDPGCPSDVIAHFREVLARHGDVDKVGFGLRIDDLPNGFPHRNSVMRWEGQFWQNEVEPGVFKAEIDTTFALYRPGRDHKKYNALRTGEPYVARHLPWYVASDSLTAEDRHYRAHADPAITSWIGDGLPALLQDEIGAPDS